MTALDGGPYFEHASDEEIRAFIRRVAEAGLEAEGPGPPAALRLIAAGGEAEGNMRAGYWFGLFADEAERLLAGHPYAA
jgi:hypothetical protein